MSDTNPQVEFVLKPYKPYRKTGCPYKKGTPEYRRFYYEHFEREKVLKKYWLKKHPEAKL